MCEGENRYLGEEPQGGGTTGGHERRPPEHFLANEELPNQAIHPETVL